MRHVYTTSRTVRRSAIRAIASARKIVFANRFSELPDDSGVRKTRRTLGRFIATYKRRVRQESVGCMLENTRRPERPRSVWKPRVRIGRTRLRVRTNEKGDRKTGYVFLVCLKSIQTDHVRRVRLVRATTAAVLHRLTLVLVTRPTVFYSSGRRRVERYTDDESTNRNRYDTVIWFDCVDRIRSYNAVFFFFFLTITVGVAVDSRGVFRIECEQQCLADVFK